MTTEVEAQQIGQELGDTIMALIGDWQANAPRTKQSTARVLGMSEMGGCREYIRATIAGDPKDVAPPLKWPAYIGTAVGDFTEAILATFGYVTQEDAVVTLPRTGIKVRGHLDLRGPNRIGDLKTRDGLAEVRREGPPFKEKAQISGYVLGKLEEGLLDEDGTGHLIYLDRSGGDPVPYVWSVTVPQARLILDAVEDRLVQVQEALATGVSQSYLRDEPESYCWAIQCPFYAACWSGYTPTKQITHPRELEAVEKFVEYRDKQNEYTDLRKAGKNNLVGIEGVTPDGTIVRWTISQTESGGTSDRLDVRLPKDKK